MNATQGRPDTVAEPGAASAAAAVSSLADSNAVGSQTRWERWNEASIEWIAYIFLGVSTFFAVLRPDRAPDERLITLGLVGLTVAWIYVLFTRVPGAAPRQAGS